MNSYTILITIPDRLYDFYFHLIFGFIIVSIFDILIKYSFWLIINIEMKQIWKENRYNSKSLDVLQKKIYYKHEKTRWFLLHSIINVIVIYYIWDEFLIGMYDFKQIYIMLTDNKAYGIVIALHIYHMIIYDISKEDRFHHLWFAIGGALFTISLQPYIEFIKIFKEYCLI